MALVEFEQKKKKTLSTVCVGRLSHLFYTLIVSMAENVIASTGAVGERIVAGSVRFVHSVVL